MHEWLGFHKVCSRWVPHQLTPQHKSQEMGLSMHHLQCYQDEEDDMLSWIVTGDEPWVHHYEAKMKHASMQWKHPTSPVHKTFNLYRMARHLECGHLSAHGMEFFATAL
jgi:hypothetical protein